MNKTTKNLVIWLLIGVFIFGVVQMVPGATKKQAEEIPYSEFVKSVEMGHVAEVNVSGIDLLVREKTDRIYATRAPGMISNMVDKLVEKGAIVRVAPIEQGSSLLGIFFSWLPIILIIGFSLYSLRQMQGGGNKAMGFGKSRARLASEDREKITFDDVAGIDEAKEDLTEIVDFLKDRTKFQKLGGSIPRGVLLAGPPGTGKTLLAKAIAGEAGVPFFSISGSDFVEMFVGVGASRVRDLFEQAKKNSPCIVFIDEIDAVGRHRGSGMGGGNDEREQTLNQLLVEMDGFEANQGVILVAATNRPDVLDPALLRPGRFDRQVMVPNPDLSGREKILLVHVRKVPLAPSVDIHTLAKGTPGFSGADLKNLVNEAALMAARKDKLAVSMEDFEQAKDKVMMGPERKSMVMTEEEKTLTAYHEGGHAIAAYYSPESDPIHKATIIPRGRALGLVMRLPERDRISVSRAKLQADLVVAVGGRLAEEIIFGHDQVTTGASSDIQMATQMARNMVTEWGMSDKLGFQNFSSNQEEGYFGGNKPYSEATAKELDIEVKIILDKAYNDGEKLIKKHIDQLHMLSKALLEHETLSGTEIKSLLESGKVEKDIEQKPKNHMATIPTTKKESKVDEKVEPKKPAITKKTSTVKKSPKKDSKKDKDRKAD